MHVLDAVLEFVPSLGKSLHFVAGHHAKFDLIGVGRPEGDFGAAIGEERDPEWIPVSCLGAHQANLPRPEIFRLSVSPSEG